MSQPPHNQDPIAFFQTLWSNAGLSFPAPPSLNGDLLERKIVEMKAVETWLQTNLSMLQASIRMLEMQKAGEQMMQDGSAANPQAMAEAWLKTLEQFQQGLQGAGKAPGDQS